MRKIMCVLWSIILLIWIGGYLLFKEPSDVEKFERVTCLINKEFDLSLNAENAETVFCQEIISRDYACVSSYSLTEEYVSELYNIIYGNPQWMKANEQSEIVDHYISSYESAISELVDMKDACGDIDAYMKIIIFEDNGFCQEFSICVINMDKKRLYYFTWN